MAAAVLAGCTDGRGTGGGEVTTTSSPASSTTSTAPATTTSTAPTTTSPTDPAGSVTLRVTTFTLPDTRAGGTGLRLVVRAASPSLRVRRRGGGRAVSVCPVASVAGPVANAECVDLGPGATVDVRATGGVELRATGGDAALDEVGLTYVPVDRSTTVVTPSRPAGACAAQPCQTTFSLVPGRPGSFTLDGRAGGGRPRLVLVASPSGRPLATVEGGGLLSIRATLEPGAEATLLHHERGPDEVAPVTAEISWP